EQEREGNQQAFHKAILHKPTTGSRGAGSNAYPRLNDEPQRRHKAHKEEIAVLCVLRVFVVRMSVLQPQRSRRQLSVVQSGGAVAAAEVDERASRSGRSRELADDGANDEVVQRTVEERERRAFAGAGERRAVAKAPAPLNVSRRQRAQGARHLGKRQVGEVP